MSAKDVDIEELGPAGSPVAERVRQLLPVIAFAGGFVFDSVTLGRVVTSFDLYVVSAYAVLGGLLLVLERRPWREPAHHRWIVNGIQFVLGALFSAATVLYFKSAGGWLTVFFVVALFGVMIANERLYRGGPVSGVIWGLYALALALISNFVLPYIVSSISVLWLYLSLAGALVFVEFLHRLTSRTRKLLRAPMIFCGVVALLHLLGSVPPVPLVYKNALVGTDFAKQDGEYTVLAAEPGWWQALGGASRVSVRDDDVAYALSAIFAPRNIEVTVEHRWFRHTADGWKRVATIPFEMRGGRREGWRVYSRKRAITPGLWRVETALADGAVLGFEDFEVLTAKVPTARESL